MEKKIKESLGNLSDKVVAARLVEVPFNKLKQVVGTLTGDKFKELDNYEKEESWIIQVENYCNQVGCTPQDIIDAHKNKKILPEKKVKVRKSMEQIKNEKLFGTDYNDEQITG
jgi:hypothetical protein